MSETGKRLKTVKEICHRGTETQRINLLCELCVSVAEIILYFKQTTFIKG